MPRNLAAGPNGEAGRREGGNDATKRITYRGDPGSNVPGPQDDAPSRPKPGQRKTAGAANRGSTQGTESHRCRTGTPGSNTPGPAT